MSPKTTNSPSKPRGRRKNPTIVPVMLASAALFASMAGFLGVQVAQGNDPMLGAKTAAVQPANGSSTASGSSPRSQSSASKPAPVQTSTSGAASPTASTTSTNSATRASAPGAAQAAVGHSD